MGKVKIVNHKNLLFVLLVMLLAPQANAFWGSTSKAVTAITKNSKALSKDAIIRLSRLSDESQGTAKVGKKLGKLNLPNDVLEDAFLRIAIYQGKLTKESAEGMFSRLGGIPGFRETLRKVIGNSEKGTIGHLNELKIADNASTHRFRIIGIGGRFNDGLKKAGTDIDILIERSGKIFAIEAKNYAPTTNLPMDKFRADLDTLVTHRNKTGSIPVFTLTQKPQSVRDFKVLELEAKKREIHLIIGTPGEQIEQIKMLSKIL